jgi:arginyl-tRNA synthetase
MLQRLKAELQDRLQGLVRELFDVEHDPIIEVPPRRDLGDLACPVALHLARTLKRSPRQIADSVASVVELPEAVRSVSVEGPGYLNFFLHRKELARQLLAQPLIASRSGLDKVVVEHTNINPNKAAHIGHLRNAVLGDVLVRSFRALGHPTEAQNYIDDTGVQLADVVVGFIDLRGMDAEGVKALPEPFDYLCWDLYAEVGRWYGEDEQRHERRRETLLALEHGEGERAAMGRLVARRITSRHLRTMRRLGVDYDLLTHEGEILRLDFFRAALEQLQSRGAVLLENEGKNAGCWVMPLRESEEFRGLEDPDKVIVRSDGTVTYVGKDIAYQLWKFGLLGRDFEYRWWSEEGVWETATGGGERRHPSFGKAVQVVNVIDARQSYLQRIVRAGLESLGHTAEAERSVHFAYEMVSLSPKAARQLGFLAEDGEDRSLEMSGRKGIGVKADDLLDALVAKSREEISARNRELPDEELAGLAAQIATAALRFFMVKATTTRVIAFDFDEALAFEGETGPYLQYSLVRVKNILRRLEDAGLATAVSAGEAAALDESRFEDDLWDLVLTAGRTGEVVEKAAATLELSLLARHALELAQKFHALYHRHPILQEEVAAVRTARLLTVQIFAHALAEVCDLLGVPVPERM